MGATPAPLDNMSKVFGNMGSNNTFESLASQSGGLSFSSLAQKSPEAEKPPVFSGYVHDTFFFQILLKTKVLTS